MGQRRDLLRGQGNAHCQVQLLLALDRIVHQVLEQLFVGVLAVDKTLPCACLHGLLDQALFIEPVAQALGTFVRVVTQPCEQVVGAHELLEVGEHRVGFDQVFMWLRLWRGRREALHAVDGLAGDRSGLRQRIDRLGNHLRDLGWAAARTLCDGCVHHRLHAWHNRRHARDVQRRPSGLARCGDLNVGVPLGQRQVWLIRRPCDLRHWRR